MKKSIALTIIFTLALAGSALAQDTTTVEMNKKLDFLIGKWKTASTVGEATYPGDLEYEYIMNKNWIKITFVGKNPARAYWEAHGLMNYDEKASKYVSWVVFNKGNPVPAYGHWADENTFRMEYGNGGIDYKKTEGGGVLQINYNIDAEGKRTKTMTTTYERVK